MSPTDGYSRLASRLEIAAFACILAVVAARPFAAEIPFRTSGMALTAAREGVVPYKPPDELLRVSMAMILLGAFALWSVSRVLGRRSGSGPTTLPGAVFAGMVLIFAVWAFVSAVRAVDVRGALTGALEQTSILLAGLVMLHLAADRRRRTLVLAVLVALAGAMAAKAIWQQAFDIPERIADYRADPAGQLAMVGVKPGTPGARMFERRLLDRASFGYLGLANIFASLMLVLAAAAAGVAIEKIVAARRLRKSQPSRPGEVHLPTLAAAVGVAISGLGIAALVLTRSLAGIAAGVVVAAIMGLVTWRGYFFARHRRKLLAGCGAAVLAAILAVAACGIVRGTLPSRSMQVRWEYWVGSAGIVAESPLLGTGPGGFGDAYLRHRLPSAEESTKIAHNVLMDAAAQYGLAGGAVYLAMLVWMLVTASGRRTDDYDLPTPTGARSRAGRPMIALWCIFTVACVFVIRAVWVGSLNPAVLLLEAIGPALIFGVCLLATMWVGSAPIGTDVFGRRARTAVACGLAGFALHNLFSYSLWMPATATIFWVAAGATAAGAAGRTNRIRLAAVAPLPVAVAAMLAFAAAGALLFSPVLVRTMHVRTAQAAFSKGRIPQAVAAMERAVRADPLDGFAPADLARICAAMSARDSRRIAVSQSSTGNYDGTAWAKKAIEYADEAWKRSPTARNARLLARLSWPRGPAGSEPPPPLAVEMADQAVRMDPMNIRFRREYAEMLIAARMFDAAAAQIREIRRIDQARPAGGDLRLTGEELRKLDLMDEMIREKRVQALRTDAEPIPVFFAAAR